MVNIVIKIIIKLIREGKTLGELKQLEWVKLNYYEDEFEDYYTQALEQIDYEENLKLNNIITLRLNPKLMRVLKATGKKTSVAIRQAIEQTYCSENEGNRK